MFFDDENEKANRDGARDGAAGSDYSEPSPRPGESTKDFEARKDSYRGGYFNARGQMDGAQERWTRSTSTDRFGQTFEQWQENDRQYRAGYANAAKHWGERHSSGGDPETSHRGDCEQSDDRSQSAGDPEGSARQPATYSRDGNASDRSGSTSSGSGLGIVLMIGAIIIGVYAILPTDKTSHPTNGPHSPSRPHPQPHVSVPQPLPQQLQAAPPKPTRSFHVRDAWFASSFEASGYPANRTAREITNAPYWRGDPETDMYMGPLALIIQFDGALPKENFEFLLLQDGTVKNRTYCLASHESLTPSLFENVFACRLVGPAPRPGRYEGILNDRYGELVTGNLSFEVVGRASR